jgi:integrase/recombinase XerC
MLRKAVTHRRNHAMLAVLIDTGCRRGEIAALRPGDVDLASGTIQFPVSKTRPRVVPLSDRAHLALTTHLRQRSRDRHPSLRCSTDPASLVRAVVRRYSEGTLTPHSLRRAFAVRWLANGGTEVGLMRIAGWSSKDMIAVYSAASAQELAQDEMRRLLGQRDPSG